MYDIQLFGRIEVRTRGIRLAGDDFGGDRPRQLLALLALHGEQSLVELSDLLGAPPATVKADLRVLRDRLEPGASGRDSVVVGRHGSYHLDTERVRVDVATFEKLLAAAEGRTPERAARPLTAASYVAARPLLEDEDAAWAAELRAKYDAKRRLTATAA
ncbi:hypothetical protein ACWT_1161 [Actinoplanes sp. SE50]|uniref:AfsR/SARP family transcriptional regulator n=1 Tax=unclassified Actinoplanes TaxID=2626549 RepID=UPI00023ED1A4|nr:MULTISPECIES: hypothetical protein [unclassified Actinoplanes]AEV82177.1 hypothetical protein ACPL_1280 [Actinoplanes sp. SE50/110]ATO80576.1 hypothetical protein ACWT_1161 [Actinoplanes sp. SE50]SLL97982.1 SARP family transcriptional regulator [Actinoplanes sp. SE50/110]